MTMIPAQPGDDNEEVGAATRQTSGAFSGNRDVGSPSDPSSELPFWKILDEAPCFYHERHVHYIVNLAAQLDAPTSLEGAMTQHLRMSGVYWSLAALSLLLPSSQVDDLMGLNHPPARPAMISASSAIPTDEESNSTPSSTLPTQADPVVTTSSTTLTPLRPAVRSKSLVDWVMFCWDERTGGFAGHVGQGGHVLYTLSALQILAMARCLHHESLPRDRILQFLLQLQQDDGSFVGDEWGEIDTRFSYCALSSLALLGALDQLPDDRKRRAVQYILSCRNALDGGFGAVAGAESHAGQVFCCVGALAITQSLHLLLPPQDQPSTQRSRTSRRPQGQLGLLSWWLAERQVDSGGLNGRPEKQADVCYSWWILSALSILGRVSWINGDRLAGYILQCQDEVDGGIADRPDDMADVYHTFFGISGLSLLGHLHRDAASSSLRAIDPIYALPTDVVKELGLPGQVMLSRDQIVDERLSYCNICYVD